MTNCSVAYDLKDSGYQGWLLPAICILAALCSAALYAIFNILPRGLVNARAKQGAIKAVLLSLVLLVISLLWTYLDYYHLRSAYEGGNYKQISGQVQEFEYNGRNMQPGTVSFMVGDVKFSYSKYIISPGFRDVIGSLYLLHDGTSVKIAYVDNSIVHLETCRN